MKNRSAVVSTNLLSAFLCASAPLRVAVVLFATPSLCAASDWPQWRGPARNGISAEKGWSTRWPAGGPRHVWSVQVGEGFSSVAVVGSRLYTAGNDGRQDTICCLD